MEDWLIFSSNLYISFLLSLSGFWTSDVWAPRFIFFIITDFLSGGLFPLDILPDRIFSVLKFLPFTYLQFFPLKVYLGDFSIEEILFGLWVSSFWTITVYFATKLVWKNGLRRFEGQGR